MSLLREIQEAAGNSTTPLQVALHHCMRLADHLGYGPFKEWVEEELGGYPLGEKVPATPSLCAENGQLREKNQLPIR